MHLSIGRSTIKAIFVSLNRSPRLALKSRWKTRAAAAALRPLKRYNHFVIRYIRRIIVSPTWSRRGNFAISHRISSTLEDLSVSPHREPRLKSLKCFSFFFLFWENIASTLPKDLKYLVKNVTNSLFSYSRTFNFFKFWNAILYV